MPALIGNCDAVECLRVLDEMGGREWISRCCFAGSDVQHEINDVKMRYMITLKYNCSAVYVNGLVGQFHCYITLVSNQFSQHKRKLVDFAPMELGRTEIWMAEFWDMDMGLNGNFANGMCG